MGASNPTITNTNQSTTFLNTLLTMEDHNLDSSSETLEELTRQETELMMLLEKNQEESN